MVNTTEFREQLFGAFHDVIHIELPQAPVDQNPHLGGVFGYGLLLGMRFAVDYRDLARYLYYVLYGPNAPNDWTDKNPPAGVDLFAEYVASEIFENDTLSETDFLNWLTEHKGIYTPEVPGVPIRPVICDGKLSWLEEAIPDALPDWGDEV